jgi:hypothetical protein
VARTEKAAELISERELKLVAGAILCDLIIGVPIIEWP